MDTLLAPHLPAKARVIVHPQIAWATPALPPSGWRWTRLAETFSTAGQCLLGAGSRIYELQFRRFHL